MNLSTSTVIGFFSLPSASLAEHNPAAYNAAMAGAPAGAGTCANCGTGIRHHVIVRTEDGATRFIGTDCAVRVGGEPARCVGARLTSEQLAARTALQAIRCGEHAAARAAEVARLAEREERFADVLAVLDHNDDQFPPAVDTFSRSLARQLRIGDLSVRQAHFACKAFFGGARQNKKNRQQWCDLIDAMTGMQSAVV